MAGPVGELIHTWRSQHHLSLGALSLKSGVHKATLSRWERQTQQPRVAELEAVLAALQATREQRLEALATLESPRALERLREQSNAGMPDTLPVGGNLLRAMRMRQGWTLEHVSARTSIAISLIARYERGEQWPDSARLHALCFALRADPQEVAALTCGGRWLSEWFAPDRMAQAGPREWHLRIRETWGRVDGLEDLRMLTLEAQLWRLAAQQSFALPLLQCAYAYHARMLLQTCRYREVLPYAERSLALARQGYLHQPEWAWALMASEAVHTLKGRPQDMRRAAERLQSYVAEVKDVPTHAWMLAEIGIYRARAGNGAAAEALTQEACQIAGGAENRLGEIAMRRRDQVRIQMQQGHYEAALDILEATPKLLENDGATRVRCLLMQTECLWEVGKHAEAEETYAEAVRSMEAHQVDYLRGMVQAMQHRIEGRKEQRELGSLSSLL